MADPRRAYTFGVWLLAVSLVVGGRPHALAGQADASDPLSRAEPMGWSTGARDAQITVIEFTDVSCPYCASFHGGTRAELAKEFVAGGQVRWVTLTYVSGLYSNSGAVSVAAECAGRQGKYDAFLAAAYEERDAWGDAGPDGVERAVEELVRQLGLDDSSFESCRLDPSVQARLEAVQALAVEAGVRGTPTWFVDGFLVMGDLPLGYARQFIVRRLPGG